MDSEESCDENTDVQVIEVDIFGYLPEILDMTSLATLVYSGKNVRSCESANSATEFYIDEEEDRLTLAYEKLQSIPKTLLDRFGSTIKILDISHNKFSNLDFLIHLKNLNSLIADNNLINEQTILPKVPKLRLLWLNHCKIATLHPWIKKLQNSCPNLIHLSLMGNAAAPSYFNGGTFYEYLQYRLYVISLFAHLAHLDDRSVTEDQRGEAKRLYKRPLIERLKYFNQNEYPLSISVQMNALERWRLLRRRMSGFFTISSARNNSHNAMI